jgi:hypothetical protein
MIWEAVRSGPGADRAADIHSRLCPDDQRNPLGRTLASRLPSCGQPWRFRPRRPSCTNATALRRRRISTCLSMPQRSGALDVMAECKTSLSAHRNPPRMRPALARPGDCDTGAGIVVHFLCQRGGLGTTRMTGRPATTAASHSSAPWHDPSLAMATRRWCRGRSPN